MSDPQPPRDEQAAPPKSGRSTCLIVAIVLAVVFVLGIACLGVLATLLMPALMKAKVKANSTKCSNNLRQLAIGAVMHADDKRNFPFAPGDATGRAGFKLLVDAGYVEDDPDVFHCPNDEHGTVSYEGFPMPYDSNARSTSPLLWDSQPHPDGRRNVAFVDAHVESFDEAGFAELMRKMEETRSRQGDAPMPGDGGG